jgi:thermostable 8-oxoguanine DNA glycosylase
MFLMHSRPNQNYAALDTHILKHLREKGYEAPATTPPPGERYRNLEKIFIQEAQKASMTVAAYDLHIWNSYAM